MLAQAETRTLIDQLLAEQQQLTAVDLFSLRHERDAFKVPQRFYHELLPTRHLERGEQFAFQVDLDACSGCKACVTACHNRNGLEEGESWREVGLLHSAQADQPFLQTITTACHHCVDPACLSGCPVLAYDKDPVTGIVSHLDDQCIGCQYCVMKCPYEVPKYSEHLGIVRKCDMCANRLATGEAPACAQACPSAAIEISIVSHADVRALFQRDTLVSPAPERNRTEVNPFLPDSPNPRITLPTTRFLSQRGLPAGAMAGDHGVPRLDKAHWPLIVMLTFTQAATGIFLAGACVRLGGSGAVSWPLIATAFVLLLGGLASSALHLGQPLKAWRAFLGWRTSWLSREIIAFNVLAALAAVAVVAPWISISAPGQTFLAWLTSGLAVVSVVTSAMVYVDTRRPLWSPGFVFGNFFGTTLLLGSSVSAAVLGQAAGPSAALFWSALIAFLLRAVLFAWRHRVWAQALRDPGSAIHFNARTVHQCLPWTLRAQNGLFIAASVLSLPALKAGGSESVLWASLVALATITSEILHRYGFFAAGASKRMPGGIQG